MWFGGEKPLGCTFRKDRERGTLSLAAPFLTLFLLT